MITAVYIIKNLNTHEFYIGASTDIERRWQSHRTTLRAHTHVNPLLSKSWDAHGEDVFSFEILEIVDEVSNLNFREQSWLDSYGFGENSLCLNIKSAPNQEYELREPNVITKVITSMSISFEAKKSLEALALKEGVTQSAILERMIRKEAKKLKSEKGQAS